MNGRRLTLDIAAYHLMFYPEAVIIIQVRLNVLSLSLSWHENIWSIEYKEK